MHPDEIDRLLQAVDRDTGIGLGTLRCSADEICMRRVLSVKSTERLGQSVDVERGAGFIVDVEAVEDNGAEGSERGERRVGVGEEEAEECAREGLGVGGGGDRSIGVPCGTAEGHHDFLSVGLALCNLCSEAVRNAVEKASCAGGGLGKCGGAAVGTLVQDGVAAGAEECGYEGEEDDVDIWIRTDCIQRDVRCLVALTVVDCNVVAGHGVESVRRRWAGCG